MSRNLIAAEPSPSGELGELKHRLIARRACSLLLTMMVMLILILASPNARSQSGQSSESMPPWTVLALKLVSATHVQPTTGIVIAAPNLVLVGVDFAREGDEIMVLDGGTDIVRHGRPASILHVLPADKLAILKVQGLNRPAAHLSALSEAEFKSLNLVAFPTAEMIEQGSAPVRAAIKALPAITSSHPTLEPFANVSGALTDSCGNLVAFNLAVGVQSMQATSSPRLAWPDALKRAANLAGTPLQLAECSPALAQVTEPPAAVLPPESESRPQSEKSEPPAESAHQEEPIAEPLALEETPVDPLAAVDTEALADESPEPEPANPEETAEGTLELETSPLESSAAADSSTGQSVFKSKAALLIIGLLVLLAVIGWLLSRRAQAARSASHLAGPTRDQTLIDEPGTIQFAVAKADPAPLLLSLSGELPGDRPEGKAFTLQMPISGPDWKVELGREHTELILASPSVSRRHAGLQLQDGRLTITDFDSTNGTRLNGVSCLAGEVFFVSSGDRLQFGEVLCSLELSADETQAAKPLS